MYNNKTPKTNRSQNSTALHSVTNSHGKPIEREKIETPSEITSFTGRYEFLSNEYKCSVKFEEYEFQSATALFYAFKALESKGSFAKFQRLNPLKAKSKAQQLINEDWENNKEFYLETAVKAKLDSNPDLVKQLLQTGDIPLLNNVTHLDDWIGIRKGKGENALGKVLMKLRDEYRERVEQNAT